MLDAERKREDSKLQRDRTRDSPGVELPVDLVVPSSNERTPPTSECSRLQHDFTAEVPAPDAVIPAAVPPEMSTRPGEGPNEPLKGPPTSAPVVVERPTDSRQTAVERLLRLRDRLASLRRRLHSARAKQSLLRHLYTSVLVPAVARGSRLLESRCRRSIHRGKVVAGLRLRNYRDYVSGWDAGVGS